MSHAAPDFSLDPISKRRYRNQFKPVSHIVELNHTPEFSSIFALSGFSDNFLPNVFTPTLCKLLMANPKIQIECLNSELLIHEHGTSQFTPKDVTRFVDVVRQVIAAVEKESSPDSLGRLFRAA